MRKEVADKWTNALRSGKYAQIEGQLRIGEESLHMAESCGFCCLGVLCDLYAAEHPHAEWSDNGLFQGEEFHLPVAVRDWAGMRSNNGQLLRYVDVMRERPGYGLVKWADGDNLVDLNDNGCSFAEIADVITSNVEVL